MRITLGILGLFLLAIVLRDAFQTIVIAKRAQNLAIITHVFYRVTWGPFAALVRRIRSGVRRENCLSVYGPLSLLLLLGLWALAFIIGFAMMQWSVGLQFNGSVASLANDVYVSASTFFTLGSVQPLSGLSKYLMVLEAGFGFSFLGLVIGYLPVLYQSFSDRELRISLLDARAGSPPSAVEFLLRGGSDQEKLEERLAEWEEWALALLQSHLSYPMLGYYRSLHANESWLGALTAIVDVSALVILGSEADLKRQAEFTFAAGRHALVHTAFVFRTRPRHPDRDRLPVERFPDLRRAVAAGDTPVRSERLCHSELDKLRAMYEPYANALGRYFLMALPPWIPGEGMRENWRVTSWERADAPFVVSDPFKR